MNMSMKSVRVNHELYRNRSTKVHAVSNNPCSSTKGGIIFGVYTLKLTVTEKSILLLNDILACIDGSL